MNKANRQTLVELVEKKERSPYGTFVNIINDLGTFVEGRDANEIEPEIIMAYAYARRAVGAALYVQGIFDRGEYSYQEMTFQNTQQMLARQSKKCQTKEFQEAASFEALVLLQTYDDRLTRNTVGRIVSAVLTLISDPDEVSAKDVGSLLQPDDVYSWLERNVLNIKGFSEEKSEIEKLIEADGIDHATTRFAEILSEKLTTREIAYQFVLEEMEAASQGDEFAREFAKESGIEPQDYKGAMQSSYPEVDGPDGPQQLLLTTCLQLRSDIDLMVKFRTMVVDRIMGGFHFGKYRETDHESDDSTHPGGLSTRIEFVFIDKHGEKQSYSGLTFGLSPTLSEHYRRNLEFETQEFAADIKHLEPEQLTLLESEIEEALEHAEERQSVQLYYHENIERIDQAEFARAEDWINVLQSSLEIVRENPRKPLKVTNVSLNEQIQGGENTLVPAGVDEVMASELFPWSGEDNLFYASLKYKRIQVRAGLTAILPNGNLVPVSIVLRADEDSTEEELLKSFGSSGTRVGKLRW